jgi:competence protein ComEA
MRIVASILLTTAILLTACSSRQENAGAGAKLFSAADTPPININTASAEELERLPHVGRKTADAIVEFRETNGPFRRVEHLMQIRGISEERFRAISHLVRAE